MKNLKNVLKIIVFILMISTLLISCDLLDKATSDDDSSSSSSSSPLPHNDNGALYASPANGSVVQQFLLSEFRWQTPQAFWETIMTNYYDETNGIMQPDFMLYVDVYFGDSPNNVHNLYQTESNEYNTGGMISVGTGSLLTLLGIGDFELGRTYYWGVEVTGPQGNVASSGIMSFKIGPQYIQSFRLQTESSGLGSEIMWDITGQPGEWMVCDLYVADGVKNPGGNPIASNITPEYDGGGNYSFNVKTRNLSKKFMSGNYYSFEVVAKAAGDYSAKTVNEVNSVFMTTMSDWATTYGPFDFEHNVAGFGNDGTTIFESRYLGSGGNNLNLDIGNPAPSLDFSSSSFNSVGNYNYYQSCTIEFDFIIRADNTEWQATFYETVEGNTYNGMAYTQATPSLNYANYASGGVVALSYYADDPNTVAAGDEIHTLAVYSIEDDNTVTYPATDGDTDPDIVENRIATLSKYIWYNVVIKINAANNTMAVTLDPEVGSTVSQTISLDGQTTPTLIDVLTNFGLSGGTNCLIDNLEIKINDSGYTRGL